jgi:hypothetical protein
LTHHPAPPRSKRCRLRHRGDEEPAERKVLVGEPRYRISALGSSFVPAAEIAHRDSLRAAPDVPSTLRAVKPLSQVDGIAS